MSAPLVVNTTDGTCWTRRAVTRGGLALYAPEGVCNCPEFVMATEAELAEHGIAGSADVLPMPVGPGPQEPEAESLPLKVVVELNDLRTRLAGMANPPREVFLALYEGAEPELFTTVEAARECCDDYAKTDAHGNYWDWTVNEHGIHVQFWTHPDDDRPLSETSGSVTPVVVQGADDLSELERLRARVAEAVATVARQAQKITELERIANAERARVAELEAELRIGTPWTCGVCGKENRRDVCVICETDRPAPGPSSEAPYVSRPLPPRDAVCARPDCGHSGLEHYRGGWECCAHLPVEGGGRVRLCRCSKFVAASVEVSADKLTRLLAPTQALREDEAAEDPCHPCGCPKRFNRHADGCPTLPGSGGGR